MNHLYLPGKVYFKDGSTGVALRELTEVYRLNRAFVVSSAASYAGGAVSKVNMILEKLGMRTAEYFDIGDTTTQAAIDGARPKVGEFEPEVIVGVGNGAVMSAAKLLRKVAEESGKKVLLVLIPTSFADGAQNTPFAEVGNEDGIKVLNEFGFIPEMSITDSSFVKKLPSEQVRRDAAKLLGKAITAYMDSECNEFTSGFLKEAVSSIVNYTKDAANGIPAALDKLHNAGAIAGNAFGNVFETYDAEKAYVLPKESELSDEEKDKMAILASYAGCKNVKAFLKACAEII